MRALEETRLLPFAPLRFEHALASAWLVVGVGAGAVLGGWRRSAWLALLLVAAVSAAALAAPGAFRLAFVQAHNLVAIAIWIFLFRRRVRHAWLPVIMILVGAALLGSGVLLGVTLRHGVLSLFGLHLFAAADWIAPGFPDAKAVAFTTAFAFLQSVHYAIWLVAIPQDDDGRAKGRPSVRMAGALARARLVARGRRGGRRARSAGGRRRPDGAAADPVAFSVARKFSRLARGGPAGVLHGARRSRAIAIGVRRAANRRTGRGMTAWVLDWLRAFGITVAVEAVVAAPLLRAAEPRVARRLAALLLVNLATHPLVWFLFPGLAARYAIRVAVSEAWAFGAEAGGYLVIWPRLGIRRAFAISVLANGASVGVGILMWLIGSR